MSYVEPPAVIDSMLDSGSTKTDLSAGQLVLRAAFSVFLLAGATALAIFASEETGFGIVGALLFPLGLVVVVLLNVELLTGNFALVPLSVLHKQSTMRDLFRNFSWVLLGHILGGLLAAFLFAALLSQWWTSTSDITAQGLINRLLLTPWTISRPTISVAPVWLFSAGSCVIGWSFWES